MASGSEVEIAIEASKKLQQEKIYSKVISVPCQELFELQNKKYKQKILGETKVKISLEAASTLGWKKLYRIICGNGASKQSKIYFGSYD